MGKRSVDIHCNGMESTDNEINEKTTIPDIPEFAHTLIQFPLGGKIILSCLRIISKLVNVITAAGVVRIKLVA